MKDTKSKVKRKDGIVFANNRFWTEEQLKQFRDYQHRYAKEKYRSFGIRFSRENEKEIIEHLESQDNLTQYIRDLVVADIENKKKGK